MKYNFNILDTRAVVNEFATTLVGKYIQNIYTLKQTKFYFKLSSKEIIFVESGVRMHLVPSHEMEINHFCKKLRSLIKNTKIISVEQYGWDRIVIFDLGRFKLVIELFNPGNLILLSPGNDEIIEIFRPVEKLGIIKGAKYIWNKVKLNLSGQILLDNVNSLEEILPFENTALKKIKEIILSVEKEGEYLTKIDNKVGDFIYGVGNFGEIIYKKSKVDLFTSYKTTTSDIEPISLEDSYNFDKIKSSFPKNVQTIHFNNFNQALAFFYLSQTTTSKKDSKSKISKVDRIHAAQSNYIGQLERQSEDLQYQIDKIEDEREFIANILLIFSNVYNSQMEWSTFGHYYEEEKKRGNIHAQAILHYNLKDKTCIIKLGEDTVELSLSVNANKNIQLLYGQKKKFESKKNKTREAMERISIELKPKKITVKAQSRESYWFEKFHYFISTTGDNNDRPLMIGGKNAQQNDLIVRRHLEDNDTYLHCDVHGASSVILKNKTDESLREASHMALVMSKCWEEQKTERVFWVDPSQVSKSAPSGEYVAKGGFIIKGQKNFIPIHVLEYGVAVVFKLKNAENVLDFVFEVKEGMEIVHAMPITGPWFRLKKYSYALRLLPGNLKKQKLASSISEKFNHFSEGKIEENFVKAIGIQEFTNVLFAKAKLGKVTN